MTMYGTTKHLKSLVGPTNAFKRFIITAKDRDGDLYFLWTTGMSWESKRISVNPAVLEPHQTVEDLYRRFGMTRKVYNRALAMLEGSESWLWTEALNDYEHEEDKNVLRKRTLRKQLIALKLY